MPGPPTPRTFSSVDFLEALNSPEPLTFHALLEELYRARFKGELVLHFDAGVPRVVEFPQPVQLRLDTPTRRGLDNGKPAKAP